MNDADKAQVDTIAAISTPPGRGGIGIVRLAGPDAFRVAEALLELRGDLRAAESHARAYVVRVLDPEGEGFPTDRDATGMDAAANSAGQAFSLPTHDDSAVMDGAPGGRGKTQIPFGNDKQTKQSDRGKDNATIDDAVVTAFHAPRSYTGDDVVEIAAHGSPVVLEAMLRGALRQGARLAGPGEFTQRAFLSGRLDLTQAEAVHDLIAAQTLGQARVAAQQLGGALSQRVAPAKERLLHLIALLEAGMDFASGELDDVDVVPPPEIAEAIGAVHGPLAALEATFRRGQLLREGAAIALAGRPNAGKSSLFNRLLERERAIVTPIPGTTRDTLEESLSLGGIPVRLVDTAGLREESLPAHRDEAAMGGAPESEGEIDEVERLGMERTREAMADADLVIYVRDVSVEDKSGLLETPDAGRPQIVVHNKIDLLTEGESVAEGVREAGAIRTSAVTGAGMDDLREAILRQLNANGAAAETGLLNNLRQQQAVVETLEALTAAETANASGLPHEVILMDLHAALRALDSLTGATTTEEILGRIFSTFCIGK